MTLSYFFAIPAYVIIILTAVARLADLGRENWELRHHLRRLGLITIGTLTAILLVSPLSSNDIFDIETEWHRTVFVWGWALVWTTTESQPPWYDYILGVHRRTEQWKGLGYRARLMGEWFAIKQSFKPRRTKKDD